MKLGMVGLGRIGSNVDMRFIAAGHEIIAFDRQLSGSGQAVQR
jgi:6-phosphogluconate dehydrogenase (decarboxylating)